MKNNNFKITAVFIQKTLNCGYAKASIMLENLTNCKEAKIYMNDNSYYTTLTEEELKNLIIKYENEAIQKEYVIERNLNINVNQSNSELDNKFDCFLGIDNKNKLITKNIEDLKSLLIIGTPYSGKTQLVKTILNSLKLTSNDNDLKFIILDNKLKYWEEYNNNKYNYFNEVAMPKNIEELFDSITTIYNLRKENPNRNHYKLIFVIDEINESLYFNDTLMKTLFEIAELGSKVNIYIVGILQPSLNIKIQNKYTQFEKAFYSKAFFITNEENAKCFGIPYQDIIGNTENQEDKYNFILIENKEVKSTLKSIIY